MSLINVKQLTFEYPNKRALEDVSFSIQPGTITALVGPNGAGKTTLMNCLAALTQPLAGTITIGDCNVLEEPRRCHRMIGYLPDFFGLYDQLTVGQCLRYMAMAHNLPDAEIDPAVQSAAQRVQLDHRLNDLAGELSRGLRQRLAIGQAIIHGPEVLLLDEPASGLDPEARHHLSDLLKELKAEGKTLLVSSHILAELADYSTHMMVIQDGQLKDHSPLGEASNAIVEGVPLMIRLTQPSDQIASWMEKIPGVHSVEVRELDVLFKYDPSPEKQQQLLKQLVDAGFPVCSFSPVKRDIQQEYIDRFGKGEM